LKLLILLITCLSLVYAEDRLPYLVCNYSEGYPKYYYLNSSKSDAMAALISKAQKSKVIVKIDGNDVNAIITPIGKLVSLAPKAQIFIVSEIYDIEKLKNKPNLITEVKIIGSVTLFSTLDSMVQTDEDKKSGFWLDSKYPEGGFLLSLISPDI
jgi:hypothetical protein